MGIISSFLDRVIANSEFTFEDVVINPDTLAWVNDGGEFEDYPGPSWDDPGYSPTPEEDAEVLGWELGLDGGQEPHAADDYSVSTAVLMASLRGWTRGRHEREERAWREEQEYNTWLRELAEEREAELMLEERLMWHEIERSEAVGSIKARKGGAL